MQEIKECVQCEKLHFPGGERLFMTGLQEKLHHVTWTLL